MANPSRPRYLAEVLAPAGELEQLKAAVRFGADAVYLAAKDFGMRAAPANFTFAELAEGVEFAHSFGVKVYQTVNVLLTNSEAGALEDFLRQSAKAGVDAFIVADIGALMLAKRLIDAEFPRVELHISVQVGITNYLTAVELHKLGASRVVLARELTLPEIRTIRENTPPELEIECFVHGAICMAVSGRCLISQYFTGRDSNHGECAQPCRWEYKISEPGNPNASEGREPQSLEVYEERTPEGFSKGSYILNSKDLNLVEHLAELIDAGVFSLKIEGRAKSSFYVASVVRCYRAAVDALNESGEVPAWVAEEVQKISHREYTTGFYFAGAHIPRGADSKVHSEAGSGSADAGETSETVDGVFDPEKAPTSLLGRGYKQEFRPLAVKLEDGWHQRGKFATEDIVEVLEPVDRRTTGKVSAPFGVKVTAIRDKETGQPQETTNHADQLLEFEFRAADGSKVIGDFPVGSFLRGEVVS